MTAIIVLFVILGIIALVVFLLHFSVRAYVKVDNDGYDIKIKYLFFTVYPVAEKKKKANKKIKAKKNKDKMKKTSAASDTPLSEEEIDELEEKLSDEGFEKIEGDDTSDKHLKSEIKKEKAAKKKKSENEKTNLKDKINSLKRKWLLIKPYVPAGWKAVKKLLKTIRLTDTEIELSVGKEDAYEAAMTYGKLNAALYDGLAVLGLIFTMHYKRTRVNCLFNENTFKYDVKSKICVRPSALIAIAFCTLVNFLKVYLGEKSKAKKAKKEKSIKKSNITETELCENERKKSA